MERSERLEGRLTVLECSVATARRELSKLRQQVSNMRFMLRSEIDKIKQLSLNRPTVDSPTVIDCPGATRHDSNKCFDVVTIKPIERKIDLLGRLAIGHIESCFKEKNGTPRQATICPEAKGVIVLNNVFSNPEHSLEGIIEYSHIWIIFLFHKNNVDSTKAKVCPPRLDGKRVGVFACRTPHRPNPIGLTLAKLINVGRNKLYVSGIDLIDGTPILDIKPYIPNYDNPISNKASLLIREAITKPCKVTTDDNILLASNSLKADANENFVNTTHKDINEHLASQCITPIDSIRTADWLNSPPANTLKVEFTEKAEQQLSLFKCGDDVTSDDASHWQVYSLSSVDTIRQAIVHILQEDPRSIYRRNKCSSDPYKMSIDNVNVTCTFEEQTVKIISIEPKCTQNYATKNN